MITQTPAGNQRCSTIVVTGASSGIGRELARQLAERGTRVIAVARDAGRLADLACISAQIDPIPFDLARIETIDELAAALLTRHPAIDGIINNAAIQQDVRFDDPAYTSRQVADEIAINLTAPVMLTRTLLPHLQARSRATIVNINSALGFVPKRTAAVYSATKAGLRLFTAGLRAQLQGSNVRVVDAIMPLVDTPMTAGRGTGKISAAAAATAVADRLWSGPDQVYIGKARALRLMLRAAPGLAASIMQRN